MQVNREIRELTRSLSAGSVDARLWGRLGSLQAQQGDWRAASNAFENAIRIDPSELPAYQGLAQAYLALQDMKASQSLAQQLMQHFPEAAFTHLFAGHLQKALGEIDNASASYEQALACNPTSGEALYGLTDLSVPDADTPVARQAAQVALDDELPVADRINAGFAIARICDRIGDYREAFGYYQRANKLAAEDLERRGIVYESAHTEEQLQRSMADYPAASFLHPIPELPIDLTPIFIIGMPRSGTTLIEQVLASHPDVAAGGELLIAHECEAEFRQARHEQGRSGPINTADGQDAVLLERAREAYIDALFEHDLDSPWVVDKMPANFEIAGFLRLMFPSAPLVHSMRNAQATCFSLYTANFGGHEPYYHNMGDLAHYYRYYQELMQYWQRELPQPFIDIVYEDLVADPESGIANLLAGIGLDAHPDCLAFHKNRRAVLTASHNQVRQPMYSSSVDHWQHYREWLSPLLTL